MEFGHCKCEEDEHDDDGDCSAWHGLEVVISLVSEAHLLAVLVKHLVVGFEDAEHRTFLLVLLFIDRADLFLLTDYWLMHKLVSN